MNLSHFSHTLCPLVPSSSTGLPVPLFSYQPPQVLHLESYPYNTDWGPAHQQAFLYHLNRMNNGQPSSSELPANNSGHQCRWLTAGVPCNQASADFDDLMVHLRNAHDVQGNAARQLVCQWLTTAGSCGKECRRNAIRRHIAIHLDLSVPCPKCGKSYSRPDSMRAHVKKEHEKE